MFESVDFPAPFSPSSACTSPSAASKSTPSFATTPGNRFVMFRSSTAAAMTGVWAGPRGPAHGRSLTLRASEHALDEPVHRVQVLHGQLLALLDPKLPALVVQRPLELVPLAALDRLLLRGDQLLRPRRDLRAERGELGEAALHRAVPELALPGPVHRRLRLGEVVRTRS